VLDDDTAVLVEATKDAFAEGLTKLISDSGLRERLAENALRVAKEKYAVENYLDKLDRIYQTLHPQPHMAENVSHKLKRS
jgi:glycosyltransferase involved in cell wall biosynthesis